MKRFKNGGTLPVQAVGTFSIVSMLAGTGDWQEGMRFRSSVSDEDVVAWVESLK